MRPSKIITTLVWLTIGLLAVGGAAYVISYFLVDDSLHSSK
jgi:hypothetical protein